MPVIITLKNGPAENIALKLESKIRMHLMNAKNNLFASNEITKRVLLVMVDRSFDYSAPLRHCWAYNSLVHDVIGINLNKIVFQIEGKQKVLDVDEKDWFWKENSMELFPAVAENIDKELNKYKSDMASISLMNQAESDSMGIKSALNAVPELTDKKRIIDTHMNMAMYLLDAIKERALDLFFEAEQNPSKMVSGSPKEG